MSATSESCRNPFIVIRARFAFGAVGGTSSSELASKAGVLRLSEALRAVLRPASALTIGADPLFVLVRSVVSPLRTNAPELLPCVARSSCLVAPPLTLSGCELDVSALVTGFSALANVVDAKTSIGKAVRASTAIVGLELRSVAVSRGDSSRLDVDKVGVTGEETSTAGVAASVCFVTVIVTGQEIAFLVIYLSC